MNEEAVLGIDPFTGLPYLRYEKIRSTGGGGGISDLSGFTTDDLAQGSNNLYSQWARNTYNATQWLQPATTTDALLIGSAPGAPLLSAFGSASAIFNGDVANTNQGLNYYGVFSYGTSFLPLGAAYLSGAAGGTAATPAILPSNAYMGVHAFSAYDGASWATSNGTHTVPGLYGTAIGQPAAGFVNGHYYLGSAAYHMLGFRSDTNAIYLNLENLVATTTIGSNAGTAVTVDGTTGLLTAALGLTSSSTLTASTTIELGNASDTTLSRSAAGQLAVEGVDVLTTSNTKTVTNKRITKRVVTTNAPGATPSMNTDNGDQFEFTGLNAAITSMTTNLSGTPVNGDYIEVYFLDNGTPRAITWGASFASSGTVSLPTTTVTSTVLAVKLRYQTMATLNKWVCVAVS